MKMTLVQSVIEAIVSRSTLHADLQRKVDESHETIERLMNVIVDMQASIEEMQNHVDLHESIINEATGISTVDAFLGPIDDDKRKLN